MGTTIVLTCDMTEGCTDPVAYIDAKGYVYCARHGAERKTYQRCRKLTPAEVRRLQAGKPLLKY